MAQSIYEKKLRRKYAPALNGMIAAGEISKISRTRDEKFLEAMHLLRDKIEEVMDEAADQLPSVIFNGVYNSLYESEQETEDLIEFLENKVYND